MPLLRALMVMVTVMVWVPVLLASRAQAAPPPPSEKEADAAFDKQDWATAARGYEALTRTGTPSPRHVMRLGVAQHKQNKLKEATAAYEKVLAMKAPQATMAHFNLACVYAAGKAAADRDRAFVELTAAVEGGTNPQQLKSDPDLAPLRSDPRYAALLDKAERGAYPCKHAPEYRQFDFWVGEWDVFAGANRAGGSRIEKTAEGCLVVEHWTGGSGHTGKSLNFFLPREQRWRQTWVGSDGDVVEFSGLWKNGEMRFSASGWTSKNEAFFRRLTFAPRTEGGVTKVRQLGEISTDGGRTFTTEYDLLYVPRATK
jgi:hypothetical protein